MLNCLICNTKIKYMTKLSQILILNYCPNCYNIQRQNLINIKDTKWYTSSTSKKLKEIYNNFANDIINNDIKSVLDIGCGDLLMLNLIKEKTPNIKCIGVDKIKKKINPQSGHKSFKDLIIYNSFFNKNIVKDILKNHGKIDLIIVQNLFGHLTWPKYFLQLCSLLMHENTILYIQLGQSTAYNYINFNTIYPERVFYPTIFSMYILTHKLNMHLNKYKEKDICVPSIIFEIKKNKREFFPQLSSIITTNINNYNYYFNQYKQNLHNILSKYSLIIGYSNSAKGNAILEYCNIIPNKIINKIEDLMNEILITNDKNKICILILNPKNFEQIKSIIIKNIKLKIDIICP